MHFVGQFGCFALRRSSLRERRLSHIPSMCACVACRGAWSRHAVYICWCVEPVCTRMYMMCGGVSIRVRVGTYTHLQGPRPHHKPPRTGIFLAETFDLKKLLIIYNSQTCKCFGCVKWRPACSPPPCAVVGCSQRPAPSRMRRKICLLKGMCISAAFPKWQLKYFQVLGS